MGFGVHYDQKGQIIEIFWRIDDHSSFTLAAKILPFSPHRNHSFALSTDDEICAVSGSKWHEFELNR